jgi:predicted site-specific integrase-resolvase
VSENKIKASEVAKRYNVKHVTVRAWLKRGLFPNAVLEETIAGKIWLIPESDLDGFQLPQMGRPPKPNNKNE